jgi:putative inorganic carbon (HCO3(-)) transporter
MTFVRAASRVAAAELPIIVAISPALLFPSPARLLVLTIVPVIWLCARIAGGRLVPATPLNISLYVVLATVAVSLYATFDVRFSLGKVSGVILGTLLFWAIVRWVTTADRLNVGAAVFVLAGAGLACLGLLGTSVSTKVPALGLVAARLPLMIRGLPGAQDGFNANAVSGCLVLFIPLQIALLVTARREPPAGRAGTWLLAMQTVLLVVTAGTVLLMQSRGAWVGLAVATVAVLCWHGPRTRVLAALMAAAAIVLVVVLPSERLLNSLVSGSAGGGTGPVRQELWLRALYAIHEVPFTGMGMNTFRTIVAIRYPTILWSTTADVAHAHNNVLQEALDLGIPGLVGYLSIWLVAGALLVIVYRRSGDRLYRAMAGGLGAGLIAHFMFGMTDAIPLGSKAGVAFWLTLAFACALHRIALEDQNTPLSCTP